MHNTFTYRHSDLPALRPEIKAKIVALGVYVDDITLMMQGNYRELEALAETLDNCLDTCELNLNSIRIIPDDSPQPPAVSMKDLSIEEKRIIYSCSVTNSLLLNMLSDIFKTDPETMAKDIASQALAHRKPVADDDVEEFISDLLSKIHKAKDSNFLFERIGKSSAQTTEEVSQSNI